MRWNETCVLVAKEYTPDDEGVLQVTDTKTEVFCNPFTVGAQTWYSMREMGISPSAEIEVRTCDYDGQRDVFYDGIWHSVEEVRRSGDFTRLVLRHQMSDSDDTPVTPAPDGPSVPDEPGTDGPTEEVESDG